MMHRNADGPYHVFWAENGFGSRRDIQLAARRHGIRCEIRFFDDGPALRLMLRRQHVDLVVLDLAVPAMNGAETLHRIRKTPATREQPVVSYSSSPPPSQTPPTQSGHSVDARRRCWQFVASLGPYLRMAPPQQAQKVSHEEGSG
jgi:CheY-like chemotaxis protein